MHIASCSSSQPSFSSSSKEVIKSKQVAAARMLLTSSFKSLLLAVSVGILMLALILTSSSSGVRCQEQLTVESRQQKNRDDLTDTIEYLENLDKYLTRLSAPRYGRSEYKQHLTSATRQQQQSGYNFGETANARYAPGSLTELINLRLSQRYGQTF